MDTVQLRIPIQADIPEEPSPDAVLAAILVDRKGWSPVEAARILGLTERGVLALLTRARSTGRQTRSPEIPESSLADERIAVTLVDRKEWSVAETARILGLTERDVMTLLKRAWSTGRQARSPEIPESSPADERIAVTLVDRKGWSPVEAARILGFTEREVMALLTRARS